MRPIEQTDVQSPVTHSAYVEKTAFTIKGNAFAFRTLIDKLYSNKAQSVLREILANAFDAHAMGGVSRPVEVSLPTFFFKVLSIRDYGEGMSHEFVMNDFSQLFNSNKAGTNVATGMFGLGSKSPFSVSDRYEVAVFEDTGFVRRYDAFISAETGSPDIGYIGRFPTTEERGVRITIPISDKTTCADYETAVRDLAPMFWQRDIVFNRKLEDGVEPVEMVARTVTEYVPGLLICQKSDARKHSEHTIYVRQGSAVYPLDLDQIFDNRDANENSDAHALLTNSQAATLVFDAPIGTFSMVPSREAIEYDAKTKINLAKLYLDVITAAWNKALALIADARDEVEAYEMAIAGYAPEYRVRYENIQTALALVAAGSDVIDANAVRARVDDPTFERRTYLTKKLNRADLDPTWHLRFHAIRISYDSVSQQENSLKTTTISPSTQVYILPSNVRNWGSRMQEYLNETPPDITFSQTYGSAESLLIRCSLKTVDAVATFLKACSRPYAITVLSADDLPEIAADDKEPRKSVKISALTKMIPTTNKYAPLEWSETRDESADWTAPAYYVVREARRHDLVALSETGKALFMTGAPDHAIVETRISNSQAFDIVTTGREHGLLDTARPIYRMTPAQVARAKRLGAPFTMLGDAVAQAVGNTSDPVTTLHYYTRNASTIFAWYKGVLQRKMKNGMPPLNDRLATSQELFAALSANDVFMMAVAQHLIREDDDLARAAVPALDALKRRTEREGYKIKLRSVFYSRGLSDTAEAHIVKYVCENLSTELSPLIDRHEVGSFDGYSARWAEHAASYLLFAYQRCVPPTEDALTEEAKAQNTPEVQAIIADLREFIKDKESNPAVTKIAA